MRGRLLLPLALLAASGCAGQRTRIARFFHYAPYHISGPSPAVECRSWEEWTWCVDRPPEGTNVDAESLLYVLHFAGGSERSWGEGPLSRKFYAHFGKRRAPAPRVVSVSYGPFWTLLDSPGQVQPALLRPFIDELMPEIEKTLGGVLRRRWVWGMSQGGLNAASLILRDPALFKRAVLSCPAIYSFPLYSNDAADAYTARTNAVRDSVYWGLGLLRPRVGGPAAWEEEGPLSRLETVGALPPVLVQVNPRDEFGFHEGGRRFAETAKRRGFAVVVEENGAGHCVIDAEQAIDFLIAKPRN